MILISPGCLGLIPNPLRAWPLAFLFLLTSLFAPNPATADWSPLIERLVAEGSDEQAIRALFSRPDVQFEPEAMSSKLQALLRKHAAKPAEIPPAKKKGVLKGFLKSKVIAKARSFIEDNKAVLENIPAHYGVPKEVVVSILLVETHLGVNLGKKNAFNNLASMALCTDLDTIRPYLARKLITAQNEPFARECCRQKAEWAYTEIKALIDYAQRNGIDPIGIPGSIYGAIGLCQFMPSNILPYGVDADQDGRIDLFAKPDAINSIANYLREHGWTPGMNRTSRHKVIFTYNHSSVYANTVLAVADKLKDKAPGRH